MLGFLSSWKNLNCLTFYILELSYLFQVGDLTTSVNAESEPRNETTTENVQNMKVILRKPELVTKISFFCIKAFVYLCHI